MHWSGAVLFLVAEMPKNWPQLSQLLLLNNSVVRTIKQAIDLSIPTISLGSSLLIVLNLDIEQNFIMPLSLPNKK